MATTTSPRLHLPHQNDLTPAPEQPNVTPKKHHMTHPVQIHRHRSHLPQTFGNCNLPAELVSPSNPPTPSGKELTAPNELN